jgi:hypothetical protein
MMATITMAYTKQIGETCLQVEACLTRLDEPRATPIAMALPTDIVIKIIATVDACLPCQTIIWSCCSKRLWAVFHRESQDWRLSRRGQWTRYFVIHRSEIEWSVFGNNRTLPRQLARLDKWYNPKCHRVLNYLSAENIPIDEILADCTILCKVMDDSPHCMDTRNLTEDEWDILYKNGIVVPVGGSRRHSLAWMLTHREHIGVRVLQNPNVPDDIAAEFVPMSAYAYRYQYHSSFRSDDFYAAYPQLRDLSRIKRPARWWVDNQIPREQMVGCAYLPPEIIYEHVRAWTDNEYEHIIEWVQIDVEWLRKLNTVRKIPREASLRAQPLEWIVGYDLSEDEIRICGENPNITPAWIDEHVSKLKYPREFWESITYNEFNLDPLC